MKKPYLVSVDDDPQVLRAIERDLRAEYRKDYRILTAASGSEALEALKTVKLRNQAVALIISDQRMPEMSGVDFLTKAKTIYPEAKSVLLTAYSDMDAAIRAINDVQLDYYLMKPWDPPEDKLYPVIDELLDEWQSTFRPDFEGIKVVGYQWSPKSHGIKDFLAGNLVPYQWLDIETSNAAENLLSLGTIEPKELPAVFFEDGSFLVNPELADLATKVGLKARAAEKMYDVVIVGAGPAGLAAAVYGASEGLKTLLVERRAPGGQAGTSSRIENYLGFPSGLSGSELARRAITQANRLGAEILTPQEVSAIEMASKYKILKLADGSQIETLSLILSTGVDYRHLDVKGIQALTGAGVYYGAAMTEAQACKNADVYVVGGGNSAGQAAMHLARYARRVGILIRRDSLTATMSQYLIDQIKRTPNINILPKTVVAEARGNGRLGELVLENVSTGEQKTSEARSLFIFIGSRPRTEWLDAGIIKNSKGFVETGRSLYQYEAFNKIWKLDRQPFLLESSLPGMFAAGDVRAGTMNRIASAVGEGAMAIKYVHEYLASV